MRILILEDEYLVAESLIRLVRQLEPDAELEGPVATVKEAREYLDKNNPDLIISDIQLADGISLDVFAREAITCPIIFTTAFNEYAIRAFKLNSLDYLLKPVDKKELKAALDKYHMMRSKFADPVYLQQLSDLFTNFSSAAKKFKERFTVHFGKSLILVPVPEVAAFIKEEIIFLVDKDGRKLITDYRSLDEVEELVNPQAFFRANRQAILHLPFINSVKTDETGKTNVSLKISQVAEITVSKEKTASLRKWLDG
jgi:two-component system, LytTR family, response regulator